MARGLILIVATGVLAAAGLLAYDRILAEQATERRALIARNAELTNQALAPGSALARLENGSRFEHCQGVRGRRVRNAASALSRGRIRWRTAEADRGGAGAHGRPTRFLPGGGARDRARPVRHCRACARANLWLHGGEVRGLRAAERHPHTQGRSRRAALPAAWRALLGVLGQG